MVAMDGPGWRCLWDAGCTLGEGPIWGGARRPRPLRRHRTVAGSPLRPGNRRAGQLDRAVPRRLDRGARRRRVRRGDAGRLRAARPRRRQLRGHRPSRSRPAGQPLQRRQGRSARDVLGRHDGRPQGRSVGRALRAAPRPGRGRRSTSATASPTARRSAPTGGRSTTPTRSTRRPSPSISSPGGGSPTVACSATGTTSAGSPTG